METKTLDWLMKKEEIYISYSEFLASNGPVIWISPLKIQKRD